MDILDQIMIGNQANSNGVAGENAKGVNKMKNIADILSKKRQGNEWSKEEIDFFIAETVSGTVRDGQLGAFVTAIDLKGITANEMEYLMRAMASTGQRLEWPEDWSESVASLQSVGYSGNKVKPIVAPAMAACGLKCPIMSSRGIDVFGGVINKMRTIPDFQSNLSFNETCRKLTKVGCCIIEQPAHVGPGETAVRNMAALVGVTKNNSLKAACMMARIIAMNLHAIVLEITYGPSAAINSKEEAEDLVNKLQSLARVMDVKIQLLLIKIDGPIGKMIGQTLEVTETVKCLNGEGAKDLHELVCKLGGRILLLAGKVDTLEAGITKVEKVLKDGTAKKKFMDMLVAQGVDKHDVKLLFKHLKHEEDLPVILPAAQFFTHLSTEDEGYIHGISMEICNKIMYDLAMNSGEKNPCSGGIQLLLQAGAAVKKGQCWARIHHNMRLTEEQIEKLKSAISIKPEETKYELKINIHTVS